jgi:hypothetical protein
VPDHEIATATAWLAAPFADPPPPAEAGPARPPRGLALVAHLARRARTVAREEGLAQVARKTAAYTKTRIHTAT